MEALVKKGSYPSIDLITSFLDWSTFALLIVCIAPSINVNLLRWISQKTLRQTLWNNSPNIRSKLDKHSCIKYGSIVATGDNYPRILSSLLDLFNDFGTGNGISLNSRLEESPAITGCSSWLDYKFIDAMGVVFDAPKRGSFVVVNTLHPPIIFDCCASHNSYYEHEPYILNIHFNPKFDLIAIVYKGCQRYSFAICAYGGRGLKKIGQNIYHYICKHPIPSAQHFSVSWSPDGTKLVAACRYGGSNSLYLDKPNMGIMLRFFSYRSGHYFREMSLNLPQCHSLYQTVKSWDSKGCFWLCTKNTAQLVRVKFCKNNKIYYYYKHPAEINLPTRPWAQNFTVCGRRGYWIESCGRAMHVQHSLLGCIDLYPLLSEPVENQEWHKTGPSIEFSCAYGYILDLMPDFERPENVLILYTTLYEHTFVAMTNPDDENEIHCPLLHKECGDSLQTGELNMIMCGIEHGPWLSKLAAKQGWGVSVGIVYRNTGSVEKIATRRSFSMDAKLIKKLTTQIESMTRPIPPSQAPFAFLGQDRFCITVMYGNSVYESSGTFLFYKHVDQVHATDKGTGYFVHPTKNLFILKRFSFDRKPIELLCCRDPDDSRNYTLDLVLENSIPRFSRGNYNSCIKTVQIAKY